ncbi:hypothetical protein BI308_02545 [Roseofilum reptotaenium AO1-A]|uniref:Uncharacterized protein n=1 Tax=Roseofilum reptotaenium AO1-A TaxID=1925591 RepID=A0A1L9QXL9_9CYAN|nr:hypothetical protein BI308_02545 [Roseofilum reptotaenium AO1-A]
MIKSEVGKVVAVAVFFINIPPAEPPVNGAIIASSERSQGHEVPTQEGTLDGWSEVIRVKSQGGEVGYAEL